MQRSLCRLAASVILILGGCMGAPDSEQQTQASAPFATIPIDSTSVESEFFSPMNLTGVRVEKDANGDERIYDSPACRRLLVQVRRLQRQRLDLIAQNIANMNTTHGSNGEKQPYRRQFLVVDASGTVEIKTDPSPFLLRYEPGHPDADQNGYVHYPNVDMSIETVNSIEASRMYELAGAILRRFYPSYVQIEPGESTRGTYGKPQ